MSMEKINITIPEGLTPYGELIQIAKKLGKAFLPEDRNRIGEGYEVKHLQTQITVTREPVEKAIVTRTCMCGKVFDQRLAKVLWNNYGGTPRETYYCSNECRNAVMQIAGCRASVTRSRLKPIMNFNQ